jgi:predicted amidohydrolase YtcJ
MIEGPYSSAGSSRIAPDLALMDGRVYTMHPGLARAEAVAVKGDRIQAVGSRQEIRSLLDNETEIIHLGGRAVIPGLIDSHMHPDIYALQFERGADCRTGIETIDDLLLRLGDAAENTPDGEWIQGHGLDDVQMGRYPRLEELDRIAPDNPLYIERRDEHIGLANSLALRSAGIDRHRPDPRHGVIDRDQEGEPTGVLRETAKELVKACLPPDGVEDYVRGFRRVTKEFLSLGLTTVHASMLGREAFKALQRLRRAGDLGLRFCVHISGEDAEMLEAFLASGMETPFGDEWLKITEVEWILDTSTSGRTAAYYQPYVGEPENTGMLLYDQEEITALVEHAHRAGLRVGLDGIGDRGIDRALDAIEAALEALPREDHRHRIEHCCYVPPAIQSRLLKLGVIDASANGFLYDLGDSYIANRGQEEMRWMWPHRSLINQGIPAPAHSDCPVCSPNPWLGIYGLVTRKTRGGQDLGPEEAIMPLEAIRAYTSDGAYAAWEERIKGSIAAGKLADLVVLDRDPVRSPADELKSVATDMTVLGGQVVFQSEDF